MFQNRIYNLLIKILFIFYIGFFIRFFINNRIFLDFTSLFYFIFFIPQFCLNFIFSFFELKLYLNLVSLNEEDFTKKVYLLVKKWSCFGDKSTPSDVSNNTNPILRDNNPNIVRESVAQSNRSTNVDQNIIDRCRRRVYWIFIEGRKDYYGDYNSFKPHFNPDVNLNKELKHWLKLQKETLNWIFNRRKS